VYSDFYVFGQQNDQSTTGYKNLWVRGEVAKERRPCRTLLAGFWDVMLHTDRALPVHLQDRGITQAQRKVGQILTTEIRAISKLTGEENSVKNIWYCKGQSDERNNG
jgi:hypothetical protein